MPGSRLSVALIEKLQLWMDEDARGGPQNMAVDQWLLETRERPLLRVYQWRPGWGSFGYFVPLDEAERHRPGYSWVRRWTGGGIVDHSEDWTYTLVIPGRDGLAGLRGGESYRVIHKALAEALRSCGESVILAPSLPAARGGDCFSQPVEHDLCESSGRKISGAGQRRAKQGLLHQGSLALGGGLELARSFSVRLARIVDEVAIAVPSEEVEKRVEERYGRVSWHRRR